MSPVSTWVTTSGCEPPSSATSAGPQRRGARRRKTLALFGRALPRDFLDVDALATRFGRRRLLQLAAEKDPGFSLRRFAEALDQFDAHPQQEFPLTDEEYQALRERMRAWKVELTHQIREREPRDLTWDSRNLNTDAKDGGSDLGL